MQVTGMSNRSHSLQSDEKQQVASSLPQHLHKDNHVVGVGMSFVYLLTQHLEPSADNNPYNCDELLPNHPH